MVRAVEPLRGVRAPGYPRLQTVHRWTAVALISLSLAIVASAASLYQAASPATPRLTFPPSVTVQIPPVVRRPPVGVAFTVGVVTPGARGGAAVASAPGASARPAAPPCGPFPDPGSRCGIT
jgi:hypothetical protein